MLMHTTSNPEIQRQPLSFGDYLTGTAYWPRGSSGPLPALIWLHPFSYSSGFSPAYGMANVAQDIAAAGFFVLAYDQVGFASRLLDGKECASGTRKESVTCMFHSR